MPLQPVQLKTTYLSPLFAVTWINLYYTIAPMFARNQRFLLEINRLQSHSFPVPNDIDHPPQGRAIPIGLDGWIRKIRVLSVSVCGAIFFRFF
jgi:hypothetical protein